MRGLEGKAQNGRWCALGPLSAHGRVSGGLTVIAVSGCIRDWSGASLMLVTTAAAKPQASFCF